MPIILSSYSETLAELGQRVDQRIAELVGDFTAELVAGAPGTALLSWSDVPGTVAYAVGRDGIDTRNTPPLFMLDPPTARSRLFIYLRSAELYTMTITALPFGFTRRLSIIAP